ncbi:MAG: hypothetical protein Tsb0021_04470 [Chlamydiales bacterium]
MEFTREPVIECVITPREGSKLVVRSSKGTSQEEYFLDSVEIVSFGGNAYFLRAREKPKQFLLPISDYEILEIKEAKMVLKYSSPESSVKIGKGKNVEKKKEPIKVVEEEPSEDDKKRDKRKQLRRRRLILPSQEKEVEEEASEVSENEKTRTDKEDVKIEKPQKNETPISPEDKKRRAGIAAILPPPQVLISETISQYRENELYKQAFFEAEARKEEEASHQEQISSEIVESVVYQEQKQEVNEQPETTPTLAEDEEQETKKKKSFWDFARELTNNK